jgi:integrase
MRKADGSKLYVNLKSLELFSHSALGKVVTMDGDNMPFVMWPDRSPCHLANMYMLVLRNRPGRGGRGLSREGSNGGSIGEAASKISPLIRYCYRNGINFTEMNDGHFSELIGELRREQVAGGAGELKRTENTITAIGRVCLDFLNSIGRFFGQPDFIAVDGVIRAETKKYAVQINGKKAYRDYLHHHSFSSGNRLHKRSPISAQNIGMLRKAIDESSGCQFIKDRQHVLITLLENTGARRGELGKLMVSDFMAALTMADPMLKIHTLKRGGGTRMIPVSRMVLQQVSDHIKFERRHVVKNTIGLDNDHGFLFVSSRSGKRLASEGISKQIEKLRIHAGISEQACAHMFRHAFITKLFVMLIERHNIENPEGFRRMLITTKKFAFEVLKWTGGKSIQALDYYIDLAFAKVENYKATVQAVDLARYMEIFDQGLGRLTDTLERNRDVDCYLRDLKRLIKLRNADFAAATKDTE